MNEYQQLQHLLGVYWVETMRDVIDVVQGLKARIDELTLANDDLTYALQDAEAECARAEELKPAADERFERLYSEVISDTLTQQKTEGIMKKAPEGLVIEGTMRPQDLIPEFLAVLDDLDSEQHDKILRDFPKALTTSYMGGSWDEWCESEDAEYMLETLFDMLEEYAPEGCYFGAIEGDGCCYGFWRVDDESLDETNKAGG